MKCLSGSDLCHEENNNELLNFQPLHTCMQLKVIEIIKVNKICYYDNTRPYITNRVCMVSDESVNEINLQLMLVICTWVRVEVGDSLKHNQNSVSVQCGILYIPSNYLLCF